MRRRGRTYESDATECVPPYDLQFITASFCGVTADSNSDVGMGSCIQVAAGYSSSMVICSLV